MYKKLTFLALSVAILTACESPEATDSSGGKGNSISFQTAITRAVGNQWENNDTIGVFQIPTGDDFSNAIAKNVTYATPDGSGLFTSDTPLYYPDNATTNFDFIAYYPYKKGTSQLYPVDVSQQTDLTALDLLYAHTTNQTSSELNVNMKFKHQLAYLTIEIKAGKDVSSLSDLNVTLTGSPTQATFDLATGNLSTTENSKKDIKLKTTVGNDKLSATSEAILIPSVRTDNTLVFNLSSYGHFTYTFTEGEFIAGKKYKLVATLSKEGTIHGVELEGMGSSIEDWDSEGGDMGNIDENFTGSGGGGTTTPEVEDGNGTESKPYSVAQMLNYKQLGITKDFNVRGYIVAMVNASSYTKKYPPISADEYRSFIGNATIKAGNFLLADHPNETDPAKLILIASAYKTIDLTIQHGLPYLGKRVNFTIYYANEIKEQDEYKTICSGITMMPKDYPLIFK